MYRNIVVGTDGSERAALAVEHAASLAAATGSTLHLAQGCGSSVSVAPMFGDVAPVDPRSIVSACVSELQPVADRIAEAHGVAVTVHVEPVAGPDALISVAGEVGAELIVCGNRGLSGVGRVLGSVAKSVLGRARCAVLVVDTSTPTAG